MRIDVFKKPLKQQNMTKARIQTAISLLKIAGFSKTDDWISIDKIADIRAHIVAHEQELKKTLPKCVLGDLSRLVDDNKFRRTLLSFIRRLALYCSSAIVRKRLGEKRKNKKRTTVYGYKLATPLIN